MNDNAPERFDPTTNGSGAVWMEPDEWGEYVSYSDYTALVAERDRLRKEYDDFIGETWDREKTFARKMGALEARAEAAEAAIQAALERLDASLFSNAEHQQAKDILRDALKPRQE